MTGDQSVPQSPISSLNVASNVAETNILLLNATIDVLDQYGRSHDRRVVLDCASHTSYLTNDLCDKFGLSTTDIESEFKGISGTSGHDNKVTLITLSFIFFF